MDTGCIEEMTSTSKFSLQSPDDGLPMMMMMMTRQALPSKARKLMKKGEHREGSSWTENNVKI